MIKKLISAATLALLAAGSAQAVTVTSVFGAPDPGVGPGASVLVDFNGPLPDGYSLTGAFGFGNGTSSAAAAPAGVTSQYLIVSSAISNGIATLTTAFDLSQLSFYWGSIDDYNSVQILGAGGVVLLDVNGIGLPPANGDQSLPATNRRVFFTAENEEVITGVRFQSTDIAFEIDDLGGIAADDGMSGGVPEPATWAMMLVGFGMVGASVRRKQFKAVAA